MSGQLPSHCQILVGQQLIDYQAMAAFDQAFFSQLKLDKITQMNEEIRFLTAPILISIVIN